MLCCKLQKKSTEGFKVMVSKTIVRSSVFCLFVEVVVLSVIMCIYIFCPDHTTVQEQGNVCGRLLQKYAAGGRGLEERKETKHC